MAILIHKKSMFSILEDIFQLVQENFVKTHILYRPGHANLQLLIFVSLQNKMIKYMRKVLEFLVTQI